MRVCVCLCAPVCGCGVNAGGCIGTRRLPSKTHTCWPAADSESRPLQEEEEDARKEIRKEESRLEQATKQMALKRKEHASEHKQYVKLQDEIKHKV